MRPVDQMLVDLSDAGGELRVETSDVDSWNNLVLAANRYRKVPEGKLVTIKPGSTSAERIIRLEDRPGWMSVRPGPVVVAAQLRTPHPVVRMLRDSKGQLAMKREVRVRALRILDALAKFAVARGYEVSSPKAEAGRRHPRGHLAITIGRHPNTLFVDELNDRVAHTPTAQEVREQERFSWRRIPTHDSVPSGRLRIRLERGWKVRQDVFTDTKRMTLEERLPQVLEELELRAAATEEREQERERQRQERTQAWERARARAIEQSQEHHRAVVLESQVAAWHEARRLTEYMAALEAHVEGLDPQHRPAAEEWLTWARQHAERTAPLSQPIRMPQDPPFTPEVIAPFMPGLSPYGPA